MEMFHRLMSFALSNGSEQQGRFITPPIQYHILKQDIFYVLPKLTREVRKFTYGSAAHTLEFSYRSCRRLAYIFYLSKLRFFALLSFPLNIVSRAYSRLLIDLWPVHLANMLMKHTKKRWRYLMRI
ncbi:unnamed protein product [Caenorhabditis brenneri]